MAAAAECGITAGSSATATAAGADIAAALGSQPALGTPSPIGVIASTDIATALMRPCSELCGSGLCGSAGLLGARPGVLGPVRPGVLFLRRLDRRRRVHELQEGHQRTDRSARVEVRQKPRRAAVVGGALPYPGPQQRRRQPPSRTRATDTSRRKNGPDLAIRAVCFASTLTGTRSVNSAQHRERARDRSERLRSARFSPNSAGSSPVDPAGLRTRPPVGTGEPAVDSGVLRARG